MKKLLIITLITAILSIQTFAVDKIKIVYNKKTKQCYIKHKTGSFEKKAFSSIDYSKSGLYIDTSLVHLSNHKIDSLKTTTYALINRYDDKSFYITIEYAVPIPQFKVTQYIYVQYTCSKIINNHRKIVIVLENNGPIY